MTDRPILFSSAMILALIAGRKFQTRRILTRNNTEVLGASWRGKSHPWEGLRFGEAVARENSPVSGKRDPHLAVPFCHPDDEPMATADCGGYRVHPIIRPGDRLYVRETWAPLDHLKHGDPGATALAAGGFYKADNSACGWEISRWKPGIHMPRWASRLTLTVSDVRIERLQDISEADAIAEGIQKWPLGFRVAITGAPKHECRTFDVAAHAYCWLWNDINGQNSWDENPWAVVIQFSVARRNIDSPDQRPADGPPHPTPSSTGAK